MDKGVTIILALGIIALLVLACLFAGSLITTLLVTPVPTQSCFEFMNSASTAVEQSVQATLTAMPTP